MSKPSDYVHCESFMEGDDHTACEVEENKPIHDQALRTWTARRFIFGIRHPGLRGRLCLTCITHVHKLVEITP